jgi:hypothetical protein
MNIKSVLQIGAIAAVMTASTAMATTAPKTIAHKVGHTQFCNFTDHFTANLPEGAQITRLWADGGVAVTQNAYNQFDIADNGSCQAGSVHLTVKLADGDSYGVSSLEIDDGPLAMNPTIPNITNSGDLQFSGMQHPFGTYQYNLMFQVNNQVHAS